MFLYVILLILMFVLAGFGAVYLLLRTTSYAPYSHLLSIVLYPVFLIVVISLLGYRPPIPLLLWNVLLPTIIGFALTLFVCYQYRAELLRTLSSTWRESTIISGIVAASMVLATPLLLFTPAYIQWWNGEFINYAFVASNFRALLADPNYHTTFGPTISGRYGAELFLAALSALTGKAPVVLVELVSAAHKAAVIVAFSVTCEVLRKKRGMLFTPFLAAYIGFAFSTILSLNHALSFLAAQSVAGASVLLGLGLLGGAVSNRRVQLLFAILLLFVLISYAEALPLLCLVGAIVFIEALLKYPRSRAIGIASIFCGGLLVNPLLAIQRFGYLYKLHDAAAGWNFLGDPTQHLIGYLAALLGFRYQFVDSTPSSGIWYTSAVVIALAVIAVACVTASVRWRTALFVSILLVVVAMHFFFRGSNPGAAYYKAYKMTAAVYFYMFFVLARLLNDVMQHKRASWKSRFTHWLVYGSTAVFVFGNIIVCTAGANAIKDVPSVYREADIQAALALFRANHSPVLVLTRDSTASLWDLMANYTHTPRLLLDRRQAEVMYHSPSVLLAEALVFRDAQSAAPRAPGTAVFEGMMIVPKRLEDSPTPQVFDVRSFLEGIAPGLRLKTHRTLLSTPAFSVVDGSLIWTGNSHAAPDGSDNKPPVIVNRMTRERSGYDGVMDFTYSDPNGSEDIVAVMINITSAANPTNECFISYSRRADELALTLDGGTSWKAALVGSGKKLVNNACTLDPSHSMTFSSGNTFTLRLAFRFPRSFTGRKIVQTTVADHDNATTGWQPVGFWDVSDRKH